MKLCSISSSQLTSLFQIGQTEGGLRVSEVYSHLSDRYEFAERRSPNEDLGQSTITLKNGKFNDIVIESLDLFGNGIVVSSISDTDYLDAFLDDLTNCTKELGLTIIETHTASKIYGSVLVVEADPKILKPLDALRDAIKVVERNLKNVSKMDISYEAFGLTFSPDHTKDHYLKPMPFTLERRLGIEYSQNIFYTTAPLQTKQHVQVLEFLESII